MPAAFSCEIRPIKIPSTAIDEGESYASMRKGKKETTGWKKEDAQMR